MTEEERKLILCVACHFNSFWRSRRFNSASTAARIKSDCVSPFATTDLTRRRVPAAKFVRAHSL